MKDKSGINKESIRLAIQAGIVASCLVVISGNFESLTPQFQLGIKVFALLLGLISMSYIMLTARLFGFRKTKDYSLRKRLYDISIALYWYIFATIAYIFMSDFLSYMTGISFVGIYLFSLIVITAAMAITLIVYLFKKRRKKIK